MPTVHIVDGDQRTHERVAEILRSVGHRAKAYSTGTEYLSSLPEPHVGCVLAELTLPEMDGVQLLQTTGHNNGYLPFVFMSSDGDVRKSVEAVQRGAVDVLIKPLERPALLNAIDTAIKESRYGLSIRRRLETLTPREYEVLTYVISGLLNKQIACKLDISEKTVKVHRSRAFRKLEVDSLAALVRLCDRIGVEPRR